MPILQQRTIPNNKGVYADACQFKPAATQPQRSGNADASGYFSASTKFEQSGNEIEKKAEKFLTNLNGIGTKLVNIKKTQYPRRFQPDPNPN